MQSLSIGPAGTASLIAPGPQPAALAVGSLSLGTGATLDLNGQGLVLNNGNLSYIQSLISGKSVLDSSAGIDSLRGIGVISNNLGGATIYSAFDGAPAGNSDTLIKSTLFGDTNLDGQVNANDYARIDTGFAEGLTGWFNGDFNYDGIVNGSDFTLMDNSYNSADPMSGGSPTARITDVIATVPEPAAAGWIICLSLCCQFSDRRVRIQPGMLKRSRAGGRPIKAAIRF
jgi:hypothetical protein